MKKGFDYLLELQCASDPVFAAFVRIWDSIDIPDSVDIEDGLYLSDAGEDLVPVTDDGAGYIFDDDC